MSDPLTATTNETLNSVNDAMSSAVQAAKAGAADARAAVDKAIPVVSRFVSRFVYTTCYTISYGVVFPSMLIARSVPKDNAFVHGFIDGARAASDMVADYQANRLNGSAPSSHIILPGS
jgi:hypothetical protein